MQTIAVADPKMTYYELLQRVATGEEVLITSQTNLTTKLSPVNTAKDREASKERLLKRLESNKTFTEAHWTRQDLYD